MAASAPFSPKAITFFRQLAKNNRREWFQPRKPLFDEFVRGPMVELVSQINDDFRKLAVDYVANDPAKVIYRVYRDTRFSKDKTPYKTHIGAHFQHKQIEKNRGGGFYFAISHTGVEIAGGIYMPGPEELAAVRAAIAKKPAAFEKLVTQPAVVRKFGPLQGDALSRVPKAYPPDHPAGEWLKKKQFYFFLNLDPSAALKPSLRKTIVDSFKLLMPTVSYFNDAVIAAMKTEAGDDRPKRPDPMF